ncbi:MAG TPA: helix-turn-helix transcriptional regulator [Devosiaceae bacterium]|jgi:DNA-binding CsgD family transcriptional regulator|nr:helix-turn-helix transcriptional regulator [Devosiaceae bacterium]
MGYAQNSLISCIYDMALRHSTWENILDILKASLPDCLILVYGNDLVTRTSIAFAQRGLSAEATSSFVSTFSATNPWLPGQAQLAPYQVFHDDQIMPREEAAATAFVRDWLRLQGNYGAGTGVVLLREGARQLTLEVRYAADDRTGLRDRVASVLGEAANHFRRAFEISRRSRFSGGPGYLDAVVEDLPFTVFFVTEDMRIQYSNFHAESLRRRGHGPFSSADGILRAADPQTDSALRQLVQKTISSKRMPTSVLQISPPDGDERYFAIARLAGRNGQLYQLHDAILDPGPLVMLVVHGSLEAASLPTDLLWRAFSLTDSEANLAAALLNGETLADFAREREVSKQTLRNQLVGVMRKTGTRRQAELVALLTRLALTCF